MNLVKPRPYQLSRLGFFLAEPLKLAVFAVFLVVLAFGCIVCVPCLLVEWTVTALHRVIRRESDRRGAFFERRRS